MKKKNLILAVLAVILVLCASIGAASAYFTTYADAKGGYAIHRGYKSDIHEELETGVKKVWIENTGDYPVFVRAKVFYGSDCVVEVPETADWPEKEEGVYYYQSPLAAGEETSQLIINISIAENANVSAGDQVDVIVSYESVPAVFNADGTPDMTTAWANTSAIKTIEG